MPKYHLGVKETGSRRGLKRSRREYQNVIKSKWVYALRYSSRENSCGKPKTTQIFAGKSLIELLSRPVPLCQINLKDLSPITSAWILHKSYLQLLLDVMANALK